MKHPIVLLAICTMLSSVLAAQSIHLLEPASGYYAEMQDLDSKPNASRSELDKISYPTGKVSGKQFIGLEPSYLSQDQVDQLKSFVQYPANSSDQTRAELDYLLNWQEKRTSAEKKRAMEIARVGYWPPLKKDGDYGNVEALFWECQEVMGSDCTVSQYPATMHLLAGVTRDMRIMEFTVKFHLMRPRPYHLEPKLDPMGRVSNPSFASGHTLWAYIQAFTFSELIPNKRKDFLDIAFEVGESREIMGIHYPSDEEAARILAHRMLVLMSENPEFRQDMEAAKKEWSS
ncbi:MAG: phosphatase PAP2 family protein [Cyclobacteriaceae bacterium]